MQDGAPIVKFMGLYFNLTNILMITVASVIVFNYCFAGDKKNGNETNGNAEFSRMGNGFCQRDH